jgi:signal transduction histidine kinase
LGIYHSEEKKAKEGAKLMEVIRSITQSQAKTQAANQQLLEQIKELRAINEQLRQEIRGGKG